MFRRVLPFNLALGCLAVVACVTVNVYFPAAAAEDAADRIIDTVTGQPAAEGGAAAQPKKEGAGGATGNATTSGLTSPADGTPILLVAVGHALEWLVPAAHAQENADIDISSPEIRAVTASMQQRFGELEKFFASGAVGLTANGDVAVRDQSAVPLAERALVKRLVAEDNADRATLYAEIAKANGHPEWEPRIRETFARRWIERGAKPGWYYQTSGGNWTQK
ncbi:MAG TPA: YdbL family protein [Steroidobacteraceae bacterium]|nr:YdbL family protein [Steroidobacteraceae bacterium]